ncbi:MAG: uroporphyrinogen-III synthase [Gammaproteobacteria bacterium]
MSKTSIVVTRPSQQNKYICSALSSLGANAIAFPCIEIKPLSNPSTVDTLLSHCELMIFISTNAVQFGFDTLPDLIKKIPVSCQFAAVGASTAQALHNHGIDQVVTPLDNFDSEELLKLPELQNVKQKSVLIIKGEGGRELLHETLESRGAKIHSIDVYQRTLPISVNLSALNTKIDLLLFTSSEAVKNFLVLTPESLQSALLGCQTIVGHARIADKVTALGFKKLPIIAATPSDTDMLVAINLWAQQHIDNNA